MQKQTETSNTTSGYQEEKQRDTEFDILFIHKNKKNFRNMKWDNKCAA